MQCTSQDSVTTFDSKDGIDPMANSKCIFAFEYKIPVVKVVWLYDCLKSKGPR